MYIPVMAMKLEIYQKFFIRSRIVKSIKASFGGKTHKNQIPAHEL
jgi:hypothetical protein